MDKFLSEHRAGAVAALRDYQVSSGDARTEALRTVADHFVAARGGFFNAAGEPDWLGRTHAYREFVREAVAASGVAPGDAPRVQAAIRYHAGAALREHLDIETQRALGLAAESPRERSVRKREKHAEVLSLFGAGPRVSDPADLAHALALMETLLKRVDPAVLSAGTAAEREALSDALRRVAVAALTLRDGSA